MNSAPFLMKKKRINYKYETCVRAVKCTYVINGTVKYTCPRTEKLQEVMKLYRLMAATSIYVK